MPALCSMSNIAYYAQNYARPIGTALTGGAHSWVEASITSSTSAPYLAKQLTALFHTQTLFSFLLYCSVLPLNDILRILVKAQQPRTRSTGPQSPTGLGIQSQDLGLPDEYSLGHCDLSATCRHKFASQGGITHYSQQLTLQHSTKLLFYFLFLLFFF